MPENIDDSSDSLDLANYWQVLRRRRWWLALPAFAIWAGVWGLTWFLPVTYRSESVILVQPQKVPEQYVASNVSDEMQDRLQSMAQQILSRTRLLEIIQENNLYPGPHNPSGSDDLAEAMRKDIQIELVQSPVRRGELAAFKIAYLASDPGLAQKVTSQLTSFFVSENSRVRQQQSEQTTQFLATQLEDARRKLADQEAKLKDFKSQHLGQLPEQTQGNVQILAGLQGQLQQEAEALSRAQQQSVYLESLLAQWRALESSLQTGREQGGVALPALDQELQRLRAQLADLSAHYTARHPDIRKLKEQIARAEQLKSRMQAQTVVPEPSTTEGGAPRPSSYAELQAMSPRLQVQSQLKSNKLEIESRQRAMRELQQRIEQYQARLNMTPMREQQLASLTRDYEQSRKSYEELLAKRDQSEMATNLEKRQEGEQFQVLDPPNLPQRPDSPNRLKLNLIGLVAGLVFGMASLAGSEALDSRIYTREELGRMLAVPVLAEIPPLPTIAEERRQRGWTILQMTGLVAIVLCIAAGFTSTFLFG